MDHLRLPDDEPVLQQLADVKAGVGHLNLGGLVRVQPDLVDTAFLDAGGEPFLGGDHGGMVRENLA